MRNGSRRNAKKARFSPKKLTLILLAAFLTVWIYSAANATYTVLPTPNFNSSETTEAVEFAWPTQGAAAIGTVSGGLKEIHGGDRQYPTASMAKTITVLVVLDKYPLKPDDDGPFLTISQSDVERYEATLADGGSNLPVFAGQQLALRNMLDGVMVSSANNLADSLAVWAFGSLENYRVAATAWLGKHNLTQTTIGDDASGLDPATTSSINNLFEIGVLAMQNDTIRQIVKQKTANFPGVGQITNTDQLLGANGFVGIKTGFTKAADYCMLFAADYTVKDQTRTIVGVVVGQASSADRFAAARRLTQSAKSNLIYQEIVRSGDQVAEYQTPWGQIVPVVAQKDLNVLRWKDEASTVKFQLSKLTAPQKSGTEVGTISVGDQTVKTALGAEISAPNFGWRLLNPLSTRE